MKNNFVMFCKTYSGDIERFECLAKSFIEYNKDNIKLYVSCPDKELDLFVKFKNENIEIITDESIPVEYFTEEKPCGFSQGYMNQQIVKLGFYKLNLCNHYFCVDSDIIFIKDFYIKDFMYDENIPFVDINHFRYCLSDIELSKEQYFVHHDRLKKIRKTYGMEYKENEKFLLSDIGFPILSCEVLKDLDDNFLKSKNWIYKDLLKIAPVEFHWYSQWLLNYIDKNDFKVKYTSPFICSFRNKAEYLSYQKYGWTKDDLSLFYVGVMLNSNWDAPFDYKKYKPKFIERLLRRIFI